MLIAVKANSKSASQFMSDMIQNSIFSWVQASKKMAEADYVL